MQDFKRLRDIERTKFGHITKQNDVKIQVGARGAKFGPDWIAIDLFDKSTIIDHNWDIMDLPLDDGTVDCIVCNAVLEHVPYPDLAVFEMHRVLKPGGNIWVEVPFLQSEHGHPFDFQRWTREGIRILMQDFTEISSGISAGAQRWFSAFAQTAYAHARAKAPDVLIKRGEVSLERLTEKWTKPIVYDSVYFWGEKNLVIDDCKKAWMLRLKAKYKNREVLTPDSADAAFPPAA
ncbi:class I SAM-dependent methyltransferase [Novosphingobium sp. KN65.2]|uniref:class I SAM-dependent methyltransferase n=1 Tax=Novosphingobium sp. KN65.2 TaxID=1478134 RepID=UPI0006D55086|nr:class I SAM-dependent methyltransferase [Novosphingobium sp. KN65.2]